jgi:hypothetical protein
MEVFGGGFGASLGGREKMKKQMVILKEEFEETLEKWKRRTEGTRGWGICAFCNSADRLRTHFGYGTTHCKARLMCPAYPYVCGRKGSLHSKWRTAAYSVNGKNWRGPAELVYAWLLELAKDAGWKVEAEKP